MNVGRGLSLPNNILFMKIILINLFLLIICLSSYAQDIDYRALKREFMADTARVEQDYRNSTDYSTVGMIEALNRYEEAYDGLLNKYYKTLLNSLEEEGKNALRTAQRNWIKLRDSDRDLVSQLRGHAYKEAGGGTIWGVVAADARVDITRRRVFEIYRYLLFGDIGGE